MRRAYRGETAFVTWLAGLETLPKTTDRQRCIARTTVLAAKLVEALGTDRGVELKEQLKERCVAERIAYDAETIATALDAATRQRKFL